MKEAYCEGEKGPQSEATPKYPVQGQSNEGYKITPSGKPSSCREHRHAKEKQTRMERCVSSTPLLFLLVQRTIGNEVPCTLAIEAFAT